MKYFAANWKLNLGPSEARAYFSKFLSSLGEYDFKNRRILFFPPAVSWEATSQGLKGTSVEFGSQNCYSESSGAFTGENSLQMLKNLGGQWNLVGHSERRSIFFETNPMLNQKLLATQSAGLCPLLCIGETLDERQSGQTEQVLSTQLKEALVGAKKDPLIVAYEPVWAIGTGVVASLEQVADTHQFVAKFLGQLGFPSTPILYGGSVKPENARDLIRADHVSGFLVGGASLDPLSFKEICHVEV